MRLLFLLFALVLTASCIPIANASPPLSLVPSPAMTPPLVVAGAMAMTGPGFLDSITVTCESTPTAILSEVVVVNGEAPVAFECQPPEPAETGAAVLVGFGDSELPDPAYATRKGAVICGTGCNQNKWVGNIRSAYCRADTGTVKITCNALLPNASAP
jgi:hypothetical protein